MGIVHDFAGLIGIDLGTTYSCVAQLTRDGFPQTLPNREGERSTPSILVFEDDTVLVGREAKRTACVLPGRTISRVKRSMGTDHVTQQVPGREARPEVLAALILKRLKEDVQSRFGTVRHAVITVPAYFDDTRRQATQYAGQIAGLNVLDILNEPTAAALAYSFDANQSAPLSNSPTTMLVFDLGGGTLDASIVRLSRTSFETIATAGDLFLGGLDWDERIANYLANSFRKKHRSDPLTDPESTAFLLHEAELAKIALSTRLSTRVLVAHAAQRMSVELTRETFDLMTIDLLSRVKATVQSALDGARITWNEIDRVLLVGGMSRTPQVRNLLWQLSGKEPDGRLSVDEVVAHGAALHGGIRLTRRTGATHLPWFTHWSNIEPIEVNSHSLGIAVRTSNGYANSILIPKNSQLPIACSRTYHTSAANQRRVRVRVLEGESRSADDCVEIGEFTISGLPANLPERYPIEVECRYARDGRISVVGRDASNGLLGETIIRRQGQLESADLESARRLVDRLRVL